MNTFSALIERGEEYIICPFCENPISVLIERGVEPGLSPITGSWTPGDPAKLIKTYGCVCLDKLAAFEHTATERAGEVWYENAVLEILELDELRTEGPR